MMGTMISRTRTVACLRSTMTAAMATRMIVVVRGGTWKAFSKAEETELPITWLIPHQQIRPDRANRMAISGRLPPGFFLVNR